MPKARAIVYRGKGKKPYTRPSLKQVARAVQLAVRIGTQASRKRKAMTQLTGYNKGRRLNPPPRGKKYKRGNKIYRQIVGNAQGTTHTTTRMIVRRTPREQRFLRKMFRTNPLKTKHINRFGFAWMGANAASKVIWYSATHLKFNNLNTYMHYRLNNPSQYIGDPGNYVMSQSSTANMPDAFIYVGKCMFMYELYNPTNYIMTVYIYDLICKHDTPHWITYNEPFEHDSSAPENCMLNGNDYITQQTENPDWTVADPTSLPRDRMQTPIAQVAEQFNALGMKPTDYHYFNTFWKVKGMKKIVLPPGSSHHHNVIFNPKVKLTQAQLYFPRKNLGKGAKNGVAGLTQSTLFGVQGQVAVEDNTTADSSTAVGTLPGKLIVSCVRKINIWNMPYTADVIITDNNLKDKWSKPTIFTDLIEQQAADTGHVVPQEAEGELSQT